MSFFGSLVSLTCNDSLEAHPTFDADVTSLAHLTGVSVLRIFDQT